MTLWTKCCGEERRLPEWFCFGFWGRQWHDSWMKGHRRRSRSIWGLGRMLWLVMWWCCLPMRVRQRGMSWKSGELGASPASCQVEHGRGGEASSGSLRSLCWEKETYGSSSSLSSEDGSFLWSWMFTGYSEMIGSFWFWRLPHLSFM